MKLSRHLQALVVIFLVAGLATIVFFSIELETVEINQGYSKEARKNDFLAAQILLERHSIDSEKYSHFTMVDALNRKSPGGTSVNGVGKRDTLILVNAYGAINGRRFDNLWQWVHQGGNLVVSLENPFIGAWVEDELLNSLGLRIHPYEPTETTEDILPLATADGQSSDTLSPRLSSEPDSFVYSDTDACRESTFSQSLSFSSASLNIDFFPAKVFRVEALSPEWFLRSSSDSDAAYLAGGFSLGEGRITVLSNTAIWKNAFIQCHDHAYFLLSIVRDGDRVWFLENTNAPSLFTLAYRYIPQGILAFCIALMLFIWSTLTRFGPVFEVQFSQRRRFYDHIFAGAVFLWKKGEYMHLLQGLRESVAIAMQRRVAGYEDKNTQEKAMLIEKTSRVNDHKLHAAVFSPGIDSADDFIDFVRILKKVKDNL